MRLLLLALLLHAAAPARILTLMTVPSHSHHLWNSKYLEALLQRGHHVTYFSVDEFKSPPKNLTQILVKDAYTIVEDNYDLTDMSAVGAYRSSVFMYEWVDLLSEFMVQSEGMKELRRLAEREKFDLVVHDFGSSWFLLGVVDLLGRPPMMGITAFGVPIFAMSVLGNPLPLSSNPFVFSQYTSDMTFWQRADNYFLHLWSTAIDWYSMGRQNGYMRAAFGPGTRSLEEILSDMNVILVNSNPATDVPFPKVPGLVPIGGLHIKPPKPLPEDLKAFLDDAKHGVVYFNLGSNVKSSNLRKETVDILAEAFRQLSPVRVLWKWESDVLANKPANVKIGKWMPQNDILAHPNVRVFFTHSGLLSTQEAVYHGKPIVGMPFFLDQHVNVVKCVQRRLGERLDVKSLTVEHVVATLRRVLTEPEYTENARRASAIFRDDIENPLDRAVYWTEYTLRHKGAPHLRFAARNLSWYQNCMLDVVAVVVFGALVASLVACRAFAVVFGGRRAKVKRQ